MKKLVPAIIFGDHIAACGAISGLSKYNIPIYMVSKTGKGLSTKSRFVKKVLRLDPKDAGFIDKLNCWIKDNVGSEAVLIIAGDDDYLDILSKKHNELNGDIKTTFPEWEIVKLVREKRHTYRIAEELGIPVPCTYHVSSRADLEKLLNNDKNKLVFPLLMKPEDSALFLKQFGNKGIVCHNENELLVNYDKHDGFNGNLLLQDLIPGEESRLVSSLVTLNRESEPTGFLINHKKRSQGKFLSCTLVATTWSDQVLQYSLKLLKRIGYYGYAGTQFKLDPRDNRFKLMEINGRVTMSNSLALKCGVNLPYLMYQEALTGSLPVLKDFRQTYHNNVIWWYPAGDVAAIFRNKEYLKPIAYVKSLIGNGYTIEPFNWRDPLPSIMSLIEPIFFVLKKIIRPK